MYSPWDILAGILPPIFVLPYICFMDILHPRGVGHTLRDSE